MKTIPLDKDGNYRIDLHLGGSRCGRVGGEDAIRSEDILEARGIGEKKFQAMKARITVQWAARPWEVAGQ